MVSFTSQANAFAAFYGAPIYLCGSALHRLDPRDYDVRVILDKEDAERLFGADNRWWKTAYYNLKISRMLSRTFKKNVDFQIQFEEELNESYDNKEKVRLDTATDEFFLAGKKDGNEEFYTL